MPGLLCFVIDGLHTETLASVRTPHLDRLGRRGASCRRLLAPPPALTLPALTTLVTSLPPEEHGVQGTSATGAVSPQAVNLLALLRYRQLRAAAFYQSDRLRPIFPPGCLHTGVLQSAEDIGNVDRDLGETAARHLQRDQPDFCLIVLQGPDIAAVHFGADSEPYRESVEQADQVLGLLLESLNFVGMGEEYTVLALGCPGHRPLPAGGVAMLPLAVAGPGIVAGVERQGPLSLLDLTPTMAALLGVDPHPDWRGQAVADLLPAPLPDLSVRPARELVH